MLSWVVSIGRARVESEIMTANRLRSSADMQRVLRVMTAPSDEWTDTGSLSPLLAVDVEPSLIRNAFVPGAAGLRVDVESANRFSLTQALKVPGGLTHIAAHGDANPDFLGYSGVWLHPEPGATEPKFLSWVDITDEKLQAELVVLNVCRLGQGASMANRRNLSFATAISAAGVDHVVAALWPVSDAATVKWVPAFYAALDTDDLESSAEALRQAQLALRASRHFRHPFYWASLVHFRHLEVPL